MLKKNLLVVLLYSFTSFLSSPLLSQSIGYNEVFQVSSNEIYGGELNVMELTNRNIIYFWESQGSINAQIYDSNLVKIGNEFVVLTYKDNAQHTPSIIPLSSGGFVISWAILREGQAGTFYGLQDLTFQIFNSDGTKVGEENKVSEEGYTKYYPQVVELKNNEILICWRHVLDATWITNYICGRKFNTSDGSPVSDMYYITGNTPALQRIILRKINDENIVLGFKEQDANYSHFKILFLSNSGNVKGNIITISDIVCNGQERNISIKGLNNGNVLCAWIDVHYETNTYFRLMGKLLNTDGGILHDDFVINFYNSMIDYDFKYPYPFPIQSIIANNSNGFLVSWIENKEKIKAKEFSNSCDSSSIEVTMAEGDFHILFNNGFSTNDVSNGNVFLTWRENNQLFSKYYLAYIVHRNLLSYSIISPKYDSIVDSLPVVFNWEKANREKLCYPFEVNYELYLSDSESFSNPIIISGIQDTIFQSDSFTPSQTYFWKVLAKNYYGDSLWSSNVNGFYIDQNATDIEETETSISGKFELLQNYPNPFNPTTTISYTIPQSSVMLNLFQHLNNSEIPKQVRYDYLNVTIKVYDVLGREIKTLVNKIQSPGNYEVTFDATNLPSGIYYYQIKAGDFIETKKMILLK